MTILRSWRRVLPPILGLLLFSASSVVHAATFVVTKTADTNDGTCDSDCSLREAIIAANANPGADVITLPAGTYTLTIPGAGEDNAATGDLDIIGDLTINGAGAATTVVNGGGLDRVFHIVSAFTVAFNDFRITGGATTGGDNGGGILNEGTLTITNCVIDGNQAPAANGAGIYNDDTLTLSTSVVSGNTANGGDGGGVYDNGNTLTITNCTVSGNSVPNGDGGGVYFNGVNATITGSTFNANTATGGDGGGIYVNGNDLEITNCTVAGNAAFDGGGFFHNGSTLNMTTLTIASNTATNTGGGIEINGQAPQLTGTIVANNTGGNCDGTVTDGGTNLQFPGTTCSLSITSADPLLGPLADNGGPTQTMAIGPGSPALDANNEVCPPDPATDQRGVTRPQGAACDIGAFEFQPGGGGTPTPTPTITTTPSPSPTPTATPAGVPTLTPTPGPPPLAAVPTLSRPLLALLGLLLVVTAAILLRRQA